MVLTVSVIGEDEFVFVAQTNIQLYNQLRRQDRTLEELHFMHRAYEFITTIYGGYLQSDGKPFLSHTTGVASIVSQLGAPIEVVGAGLAHNIYGNGDFGDGLSDIITNSRRNLVIAALGERVEDLISRFPRYRITLETIDDITARLDDFDEDERHLLLIELADHLEKYVDLGVLYYGDDRWARTIVEVHGDRLCQIASRLGQPDLGFGLSEAFGAVEAEETHVSDRLRTSDGRQYSALVVPRSCRRRAFPYLVSRIRKWTRRAYTGVALRL